MIVRRKKHVYVFGFSVDEGDDVVLGQIIDRDTTGPYRLPGNTIILIGLSFKRDSHRLQEFVIGRLGVTGDGGDVRLFLPPLPIGDGVFRKGSAGRWRVGEEKSAIGLISRG